MSAVDKIQLDWEAHLEALPLATWITRTRADPQGALVCGSVFLNGACRDALGVTEGPAEDGAWTRYLHPEDRQGVLSAWAAFVEGRSPRFDQVLRWIRPDTKETVSLAVRAQKLLCGDIQGWLRSTAAEEALSRLEELTHAPARR